MKIILIVVGIIFYFGILIFIVDMVTNASRFTKEQPCQETIESGIETKDENRVIIS